MQSLGRRAEVWRIGGARRSTYVLTRAGVELEGSVSGREIAEVIGARQARAAGVSAGAPLERAAAELASGRSFWDTVWQASLDREINRGELRRWLAERQAALGGNLKRLAASLNVEADYPRFISALDKYDIHPGPRP